MATDFDPHSYPPYCLPQKRKFGQDYRETYQASDSEDGDDDSDDDVDHRDDVHDGDSLVLRELSPPQASTLPTATPRSSTTLPHYLSPGSPQRTPSSSTPTGSDDPEIFQELHALSLGPLPSSDTTPPTSFSLQEPIVEDDKPSKARDSTVVFLESLMTSFIRQLKWCVVQLDKVHKEGARPQRAQQDADEPALDIQMSLLNRSNGNHQTITYPDKPDALKRMARVLFIASVLYQTVLENGHVTKRDIYYRNVALFGSQSVVDKVGPYSRATVLTFSQIVDDLIYTAGLKRQDFHVCAASKGLITSNALSIHLVSGEELPVLSAAGTLIPPQERIARLEAPSGLDWVLVVEKDAVMQSLCGAGLLNDTRLGPGAIVTGKGYPDLSTLQLLRNIADSFPDTRIYALVDADPHGIDILSVYTFGSRANAFAEDYQGLPLGDRMQWIGVKASEWSSIGRYDDLLPLGDRDVQLALKMCSSRKDMPREWRRELAHMVHVHRKAEIQILCGIAPSNELERALTGVQLEDPSNRLVEYVVQRIQGGV